MLLTDPDDLHQRTELLVVDIHDDSKSKSIEENSWIAAVKSQRMNDLTSNKSFNR